VSAISFNLSTRVYIPRPDTEKSLSRYRQAFSITYLSSAMKLIRRQNRNSIDDHCCRDTVLLSSWLYEIIVDLQLIDELGTFPELNRDWGCKFLVVFLNLPGVKDLALPIPLHHIQFTMNFSMVRTLQPDLSQSISLWAPCVRPIVSMIHSAGFTSGGQVLAPFRSKYSTTNLEFSPMSPK
jgi:hypothetical protein